MKTPAEREHTESLQAEARRFATAKEAQCMDTVVINYRWLVNYWSYMYEHLDRDPKEKDFAAKCVAQFTANLLMGDYR